MSERLFKRMANEYLHEYGARLRRELSDAGQDPAGLRISPARELRMRRDIASIKRARYIRYAGLIAACIIVAISLTVLPDLYSSRTDTGEYAPAPAATPAATPSAVPAVTPSAVYETLSLTFDLPVQFTAASVEQDIEKTVYCLEDKKSDDVIMTLERRGDISRYDTLTSISIGGHTAFGSSGNGYNLLAFVTEENDVLYVLTCKYDINTLIILGESILI